MKNSLSPKATEAVPEIAAFLRRRADFVKGKLVSDGLRVAALMLESEAEKERKD